MSFLRLSKQLKIKKLAGCAIGTVLVLSACQMEMTASNPQTDRPPALTDLPTSTAALTATEPAPATRTPFPSPSNPVVSSPAGADICSPLSGYNRIELEAAVFNPYNPPAAGLDGPHQGVDFADLEPTNRYAQEGLAVQAVLPGKVASIIHDRFPYGNALMLETPLKDLSSNWLKLLNLPAAQPSQTPNPALTCPDMPLPGWDLQTRSLYLLYAHLQQAPELEPGDPVACGQVLGTIGSSGNALNPHLHLEVRVGPSGARFASLAHYDTSALPEEMANYCLWRVRGIFQLIDPLLLLQSLP